MVVATGTEFDFFSEKRLTSHMTEACAKLTPTELSYCIASSIDQGVVFLFPAVRGSPTISVASVVVVVTVLNKFTILNDASFA